MIAETTYQIDPAGIVAAIALAITAAGGLIATLRSQRHYKVELKETKGELSEVKRIVQGNGKGDMTQMLETIIDAVEDVRAKAEEVKRSVDLDRQLTSRRVQNVDDQLVSLGKRVDGISRHQREDRAALDGVAEKVDKVVVDTEEELTRLRTETTALVFAQLAEKFPRDEGGT